MTKTKGSASIFDQRLGAAMRARRLLIGMSQEEVANGVGVTFQQIQKREDGKNRVSAEDLVLTAELLNVTPQELLDEAYGKGRPPAPPERSHLAAMRMLSRMSPQRLRTVMKMIRALAAEEPA